MPASVVTTGLPRPLPPMMRAVVAAIVTAAVTVERLVSNTASSTATAAMIVFRAARRMASPSVGRRSPRRRAYLPIRGARRSTGMASGRSADADAEAEPAVVVVVRTRHVDVDGVTRLRRAGGIVDVGHR